MYSKRPDGGDGPVSKPLRTSDRIRRRPKLYGRSYMYYSPTIARPRKNKTKNRAAASRIAKMLCPGNRVLRTSNSTSITPILRRSKRKRRTSSTLLDYMSSASDDGDLMKSRSMYHALRSSIGNTVNNELSPKHKRTVETTPRREGLRPRRSRPIIRDQLKFESGGELDSSEEKVLLDESENGIEIDENDADDDQMEEEADNEGGEECDEEDEEDDREDDGDDEDGEEEQGGRKRYDLRNRSDVRRMSVDEGKQRSRSPRRVLHQGIGPKVNRDVRKSGSKVHKRHRLARAEDSDDSLLVDELDQGPALPWGRGGGRSGPPWLFGGLDVHGGSTWGLNVAASGWGHQGDSISAISTGTQTAGPSSKGGADIQPLQVDDSINFDDIGGLSEYINSLKEMVFFPLLYPDFFATYNITPPRGVLLCGPPGTGKTLIARALACAASKAGQKVSFYMRKGADVLSKWVGEAERQLKLLFEEAQRNQPSIIFFDEIDGLAPVRSSKQEQIHNSIVSTLLALMDGLDSRGQVVLIGATNRVDAIDGALRRPGRFDREFNFPLPGFEARGEILEIHTRKWRQPPGKELKLELAACCVGYCGADIKALCTEAAIRAFREKYPQVYTSDEKFLIDVDSVKVDRKHFFEAMSTITPAAHRGAIVHSRPLSIVVAPCLQRHLKKAMECISDIFPPIALASEFMKLSMLSFGSAIPLVYRPRLLLCGDEPSGLDHLGPAILHELEKFPVHSLGLAELLSDPSAKTPEEALVHIFGEARRTTPSILYLPHLNLWWDNAHEQLKAVLLTLLDELPSNLPILLLGTSSSSVPYTEEDLPLVFSSRSFYFVDKPSVEDRSLFFDRLIEAALSVVLGVFSASQKSESLPELPRAPKVVSGPKVSELKVKVEAEQHALRRMRMCLRDVCNRLLYDKRYSAFHYPVTDEDAPNYRSIIQNPMDIATVLHRVDSGQYITCSAFLEDVDLIVSNAKVYNGDDYTGNRIVSRAHELRDAVHGMLSQMDPALVTYCDKISAQGGPTQVPDELGGSIFSPTPVVQAVTRASARLRNVQLEVNIDQSMENSKKIKKNVDVAPSASNPEEGLQNNVEAPRNVTEESDPISVECDRPHSTCDVPVEACGSCADQAEMVEPKDPQTLDPEVSTRMEYVKRILLQRTDNFGIPQLEKLYARIMKGVFEIIHAATVDDHRCAIFEFLVKFADTENNFSI